MTALPPSTPPRASATRRRGGRPLVITGIVAIVVGAGAGVAAAVTGSSSPSPSPSATVPAPTMHRLPGWPGLNFRPGPGGFGLGRLGALGGGPFGALHGEFVVAKPGGGYQTVDMQRGLVTAVNSGSITLKSTDGFVKSYTVSATTNVNAQRDGIGSVKIGDQVAVTATVSAGTATAASVIDLSNLQGLRQRFFSGGQPPANPG